MQHAKILTLTALVMLSAAVLACRLVPRMESSTRVLPVNDFPRQFNGWKAGPDIPTDPQVQLKLPTARILQRDYTNAQGKVANLMLVTATDEEDFHKPTACLPAQGWALQDRPSMMIGGRPVKVVNAVKDNNGFTVYYYWVKLKGKTAPEHTLMATAVALRKHLVHEEMSLFVRIVMPDRVEDRPDLVQFTTAVWSALQPMIGPGAEVVLRS